MDHKKFPDPSGYLISKYSRLKRKKNPKNGHMIHGGQFSLDPALFIRFISDEFALLNTSFRLNVKSTRPASQWRKERCYLLGDGFWAVLKAVGLSVAFCSGLKSCELWYGVNVYGFKRGKLCLRFKYDWKVQRHVFQSMLKAH